MLYRSIYYRDEYPENDFFGDPRIIRYSYEPAMVPETSFWKYVQTHDDGNLFNGDYEVFLAWLYYYSCLVPKLEKLEDGYNRYVYKLDDMLADWDVFTEDQLLTQLGLRSGSLAIIGKSLVLLGGLVAAVNAGMSSQLGTAAILTLLSTGFFLSDGNMRAGIGDALKATGSSLSEFADAESKVSAARARVRVERERQWEEGIVAVGGSRGKKLYLMKKDMSVIHKPFPEGGMNDMFNPSARKYDAIKDYEYVNVTADDPAFLFSGHFLTYSASQYLFDRYHQKNHRRPTIVIEVRELMKYYHEISTPYAFLSYYADLIRESESLSNEHTLDTATQIDNLIARKDLSSDDLIFEIGRLFNRSMSDSIGEEIPLGRQEDGRRYLIFTEEGTFLILRNPCSK